VSISVLSTSLTPSMPALKLLQAACAGTDAIELDKVPADVTVCNAYGHPIAVAEYVMMSMIVCAHQFLKIHQGFVQGKWYWSGLPVHPPHAEVYGKTVCLIGLGRIGQETARRAKAMGMRVVACNRTTARQVSDVDEIGDLSSVARLAATADFVVAACALTPETRYIVSREVLAAMKSSAFIINVGRGPLVDEHALYQALSTHQIAGAVLDAWYRYPTPAVPHPPPSEYPFAQLDNVIMTPHISGWTDGMIDRRWSEIAANLDRFARHQPLGNVIRSAR
jgi:phosphoglycerate dehydrogenase-like enzyme